MNTFVKKEHNGLKDTRLSDQTACLSVPAFGTIGFPIQLAKRDTYLSQIEQEIRNKKGLLIKKKKELDKKTIINEFLGEVSSDYNKYYDYILSEKQKQYNALQLLREYMNDLIKTENLVDDQLRSAKHEQRTILDEIDNVKKELDELVTNKNWGFIIS